MRSELFRKHKKYHALYTAGTHMMQTEHNRTLVEYCEANQSTQTWPCEYSKREVLLIVVSYVGANATKHMLPTSRNRNTRNGENFVGNQVLTD